MEERFTAYTLRTEATLRRQRDIITRLTEQHVVMLGAHEAIAAERDQGSPRAVAAAALATVSDIGARFRAEAAAAESDTQGSGTPQDNPEEKE